MFVLRISKVNEEIIFWDASKGIAHAREDERCPLNDIGLIVGQEVSCSVQGLNLKNAPTPSPPHDHHFHSNVNFFFFSRTYTRIFKVQENPV